MKEATTILTNFEDAGFDELVKALQAADDAYHNSGEPLVEDRVYDIAKRFAAKQNPADVYFTGIGSSVRGGKVKLPYQMGSLDQVYEGEVEGWVRDNRLSKAEVVITDKLDGTSALIVYGKDGKLQIAYSRGNGIEGADITRHIRLIPSVPKQVSEAMVVRAEVIIPKANFESLKRAQTRSSGDAYKNPRNAVAGIMNSKTNKTAAYKFIHVVAYEALGNDWGKDEQLELIANEGFKVPGQEVWLGSDLNDENLTELLNRRRAESEYELDGVVIDVNSAEIRARMNPTKTTLNPAYAVKYKVASADNVKNVRVTHVEWRVSKHGYLKPRVHYEPTQLMGVTVQHATGFNAKFIKDNGIGDGAIIKITRSGDVIPFIIETVEKTKVKLPEGEWSETGVDLIATEDNEDAFATAMFKSVAEFFASIDAPGLKEGSIAKLFNNGFTTVAEIINADEMDFLTAMGKNGLKAYEGLHTRLQNIKDYELMGSLNCFGRGVGKRKFKKLFETIDSKAILTAKVSQIAAVEGFDTKTAQKIVDGMPIYKEFWSMVKDKVKFVVPKTTGVSMDGQSVVFTGFRDKDLAAEVEANGGRIQSGVSSKTTILVAANPNSNSGKAKKARDLGIMVIGIDELRDML